MKSPHRKTKNLIQRIFEDLGVFEYKNIFVISDLLKLFSNKSFTEVPFFFDMLKSSLEDLSKYDKTIILPSFTYQFCQTKIFDVALSKAQTGALPNSLITSGQFKRTLAPITSHLISGNQAPESLFESPSTTFGNDSIYSWLLENDGLILNLGLPISSANGWILCHHVEEVMSVPYRHYKTFDGDLLKNGKFIRKCSQKHFVRTNFEHQNDFSKLNRCLAQRRAIIETEIDGLCANSVSAVEVFETTKALIEQNPKALLTPD